MTVLVGVAVGGRAVAGVVSQPYFNYQEKSAEQGRIIWGINGLGVFGLTPKPPTDRLVVTTSRTHGTSVVDKAVNSLEPAEVSAEFSFAFLRPSAGRREIRKTEKRQLLLRSFLSLCFFLVVCKHFCGM